MGVKHRKWHNHRRKTIVNETIDKIETRNGNCANLVGGKIIIFHKRAAFVTTGCTHSSQSECVNAKKYNTVKQTPDCNPRKMMATHNDGPSFDRFLICNQHCQNRDQQLFMVGVQICRKFLKRETRFCSQVGFGGSKKATVNYDHVMQNNKLQSSARGIPTWEECTIINLG